MGAGHNPEAENPRDYYKRFRHSLSEHLAFWAQLAFLAQAAGVIRYGISYPNFLSEDKGPDGLALAIDDADNATTELRSVKSSVKKPNSSISSGSFRRRGEVDIKHLGQLDEFWKVAKEAYGFRKLETMLDFVAKQITISINQESRVALLGSSTKYNGIVVANDIYASSQVFSGFHFVHSDPNYCIATYIGADNWAQLADQVHIRVEQILLDAGVLDV